MNTPTPTPKSTPDHDRPPRRRVAMAGAFWMLARVVIVLPLLTPVWILYALCAGAGELAEFFEALLEALCKRFRLAFAEREGYAQIERVFDERRELRVRVRELEEYTERLEKAGDAFCECSDPSAWEAWSYAKEAKP